MRPGLLELAHEMLGVKLKVHFGHALMEPNTTQSVLRRRVRPIIVVGLGLWVGENLVRLVDLLHLALDLCVREPDLLNLIGMVLQRLQAVRSLDCLFVRVLAHVQDFVVVLGTVHM